jgi:hypothetical protein
VRGQKCGHLLGQQALRQRRQERRGFGEGKAEMRQPFGLFVQDHHVLGGGLVRVVGRADEW